ncbi:MAG: hypothetical protein QW724_03810 [Nitrososphaerota archaeon]
MVYYVDVANSLDSKKRSRKVHTVFDGERCFKVEKLTELKDATEIYIDVLLPSNYDEVYELISNGKRVYILREPKHIKRVRAQNNLKKNDENDARALSIIPKDFFRELKLEEIQLKKQLQPLVSRYEVLTKRIKTLKQWLKDSNDLQLEKSLINRYRREKTKIGDEIHNLVMDNKLYNEALRYFGLNKSVDLAILVTEIDFSRGKRKIKDYLGLYKKEQKYTKNYNHKLRGRLSKFSQMYYTNINKMKVKVPKKYIDIIEASKGKKKKILHKIQCKVIEDLRRLYRQIQTTQEVQAAPTSR